MNIVTRVIAARPPAPANATSERWARRRYAKGLLAPGVRGLIVRFIVAAFWLSLVVAPWFGNPRDTAIGYMPAAIVLSAAAFSLALPIVWLLPPTYRIWVIVALMLVELLLWPALGWDVVMSWVLVSVVLGHAMFSTRTTICLALALAALALVFQLIGYGWPDVAIWLPNAPTGSQPPSGVIWLPVVIATIPLMISGYARQRAAITELDATRHELARLAVDEERGRLARDMHDILGHSLTAITVKAELTGMLLDADHNEEAKNEITAVEALARDALADVRYTVAGYREVTALGELANAQAILESAEISAELPASIDDLPPRVRDVAGWLIREGVTNVVRHSGASQCRISADAYGIEVADNGNGVAHDDHLVEVARGNGIRGLRERVESSGCSLVISRSDLGGLSIRVHDGAAS